MDLVVLSDVFSAVGAVVDLGLEGPDEAVLADVVAARKRHRIVEQRLTDDALEDFLNLFVPLLKITCFVQKLFEEIGNIGYT